MASAHGDLFILPRHSMAWIVCRLPGAQSADQEGWVAQARKPSLDATAGRTARACGHGPGPPRCGFRHEATPRITLESTLRRPAPCSSSNHEPDADAAAAAAAGFHTTGPSSVGWSAVRSLSGDRARRQSACELVHRPNPRCTTIPSRYAMRSPSGDHGRVECLRWEATSSGSRYGQEPLEGVLPRLDSDRVKAYQHPSG